MAKIITICDGMGHMRVDYRLRGEKLELITPNWRDVFEENICWATEDMDDDDIAAEVYRAWTHEGYEGDPGENGLAVTVKNEAATSA